MRDFESSFAELCGWAAPVDAQEAEFELSSPMLGIPRKLLEQMGSRGKTLVVSPCLVGVRCRYDGGHNLVAGLGSLLDRVPVRLICPEVLAGFGVPRPPIHFLGGDGAAFLEGRARLVDERGRDRSTEFLLGVRRALLLSDGVAGAVLKEGSPSCGLHRVHVDDAFVPGRGAFAAALEGRGVSCFSEGSLDELKSWLRSDRARTK